MYSCENLQTIVNENKDITKNTLVITFQEMLILIYNYLIQGAVHERQTGMVE